MTDKPEWKEGWEPSEPDKLKIGPAEPEKKETYYRNGEVLPIFRIDAPSGFDEVMQMKIEIAQLKEENAKLREIAMRVDQRNSICPFCDRYSHEVGHAPKCKLIDALGETSS